LFCAEYLYLFSKRKLSKLPFQFFPGNYSQQPIITSKEGFLESKDYYWMEKNSKCQRKVGELLNSNRKRVILNSEGPTAEKGWGALQLNLTGLADKPGLIAISLPMKSTPAPRSVLGLV